MNQPIFDIITGLSGAGKTLASHYMEDFGYFCVDNLPPMLIPTLAELCTSSRTPIERVALVIDIREGEFFDDLFEALDELRAQGFTYRILFLEADDETLVKRYKETRRRHPLSNDGRDLMEAIKLERERLAELKDRATLVLDTSTLNPWELRDELARVFFELPKERQVLVKVVSFGFKNGLPMDSDLIFDVRFLVNPNYQPDLKSLDGTYAKVREFVLSDEATRQYLQKLFELMEFSLPNYIKEGKSYLSIGIGCTGGRHRSVVVAEELANFLRSKGYTCLLQHRDMRKET